MTDRTFSSRMLQTWSSIRLPTPGVTSTVAASVPVAIDSITATMHPMICFVGIEIYFSVKFNTVPLCIITLLPEFWKTIGSPLAPANELPLIELWPVTLSMAALS
jgi:hypothetical protein